MANGRPIEGEEALIQRAGAFAWLDVPTCGLTKRMGEVKERVQKAGWDSCVVVFEDRVVMGLLRPEALKINPQATAEQAMESGTRTYRLNAPLKKPMQYMQKMVADSVVVTTSDGRLFGLLKREDVEDALSKQEKQAEELKRKR
jgi:predicted transcriptional regulator